MAKPYEIHGIPENVWLEFDEPPDYAVIYERKDKDTFDRSYGLVPGDIRLWGQAEYWTALEAALLLVGVSPDDYEATICGIIQLTYLPTKLDYAQFSMAAHRG